MDTVAVGAWLRYEFPAKVCVTYPQGRIVVEHVDDRILFVHGTRPGATEIRTACFDEHGDLGEETVTSITVT